MGDCPNINANTCVNTYTYTWDKTTNNNPDSTKNAPQETTAAVDPPTSKCSATNVRFKLALTTFNQAREAGISDQAIALYDQFINSNYNSPLVVEAYLGLAFAYFWRGNFQKATNLLQTLCNRFPLAIQTQEANFFLGMIQLKTGKHPAALTTWQTAHISQLVFQQIIKRFPQSIFAAASLFGLAQQTKDASVSFKLLTQAEKILDKEFNNDRPAIALSMNIKQLKASLSRKIPSLREDKPLRLKLAREIVALSKNVDLDFFLDLKELTRQALSTIVYTSFNPAEMIAAQKQIKTIEPDYNDQDTSCKRYLAHAYYKHNNHQAAYNIFQELLINNNYLPLKIDMLYLLESAASLGKLETTLKQLAAHPRSKEHQGFLATMRQIHCGSQQSFKALKTIARIDGYTIKQHPNLKEKIFVFGGNPCFLMVLDSKEIPFSGAKFQTITSPAARLHLGRTLLLSDSPYLGKRVLTKLVATAQSSKHTTEAKFLLALANSGMNLTLKYFPKTPNRPPDIVFHKYPNSFTKNLSITKKFLRQILEANPHSYEGVLVKRVYAQLNYTNPASISFSLELLRQAKVSLSKLQNKTSISTNYQHALWALTSQQIFFLRARNSAADNTKILEKYQQLFQIENSLTKPNIKAKTLLGLIEYSDSMEEVNLAFSLLDREHNKTAGKSVALYFRALARLYHKQGNNKLAYKHYSVTLKNGNRKLTATDLFIFFSAATKLNKFPEAERLYLSTKDTEANRELFFEMKKTFGNSKIKLPQLIKVSDWQGLTVKQPVGLNHQVYIFDQHDQLITILAGGQYSLSGDRNKKDDSGTVLLNLKNGTNVVFRHPKKTLPNNYHLLKALRTLPKGFFKGLKTIEFNEEKYLKTKAGFTVGLYGDNQIILFTSAGYRTLVHEMAGHHFDLSIAVASNGQDALIDNKPVPTQSNSDLSTIFYQISWLDNKLQYEMPGVDCSQGYQQEQIKENGLNASDFVSGYARCNRAEDFAEAVSHYVHKGYVFRSSSLGLMNQERQFAKALKYLFIKHLTPFAGREYGLDKTASLTLATVENKLKQKINGLTIQVNKSSKRKSWNKANTQIKELTELLRYFNIIQAIKAHAIAKGTL